MFIDRIIKLSNICLTFLEEMVVLSEKMLEMIVLALIQHLKDEKKKEIQ